MTAKDETSPANIGCFMLTENRVWDDGVSDDELVVREQPAIYVYINSTGHVVVREAGGPCDYGDTVVTIAPEFAASVADAIRRCAAEIAGNNDADNGRADADQSPKPRRKAPMTAAERKRKQRDMSRNDVTRERDKRDTNGGTIGLPFLPPLNDEHGEGVSAS